MIKPIQYPVRCKIVDVAGMKKRFRGQEFILNTPEASKPHIGKQGVAENMEGGIGVRITLDDGTIIYGHECWWTPIKES